MAKKQKKDTKAKAMSGKALKQQKRHRRQWVTFWRMCRYGVNNFTRNAWLTLAATAVMTITLFVIFVSAVSQNILHNTLEQVRDKVTMAIYLKTETTQEEANTVAKEVEKLGSVVTVTISSPSDARDAFIEQSKDDAETLDAVKEATNRFPWTLNIRVVDINNTQELATLVEENETVKAALDPNRDPSFAGERRDAIESIARTAAFAQQVGIIASAVFVGISMLIIFNTIRMAIFNRREEIQMMKLIGAERSFIRGPFIVEATVYGFFAALLASALGFGLLLLAAPSLANFEVNIQPTIDLITFYAGFILLGMILIGAVIGIISSMLATRRYLKP
ncbi:ABC transporter permease [Candidatus Saccharibacteria bacterium]|nr:ABC transporter permease [Candidatus Saccharibacteria bacterium]